MNITIYHPLRKKLGLSIKEYVIIDCIYYQSYLIGKKINSREIAELFDFTKSSVEYFIRKLIYKGYLQKNDFNKNITVTELIKIEYLNQTK